MKRNKIIYMYSCPILADIFSLRETAGIYSRAPCYIKKKPENG